MQLLIQSPILQTIRLDFSYFYDFILKKHPVLHGHEKQLIQSLEAPFTIRKSLHDSNVHLFYSIYKERMLCCVVKVGEPYCFLITAYPCDSVKKGDIVWQK